MMTQNKHSFRDVLLATGVVFQHFRRSIIFDNDDDDDDNDDDNVDDRVIQDGRIRFCT